WGTVNPVMISDSEFGPVRLCAYGLFCFHVAPNPINFVRKVVKMEGSITDFSISEQLRNFAIDNFTKYLVESKIAVLDLAVNLNEFSNELTLALNDRFLEYGIELTRFLIESISLPEAVEQALYKRADSGGVGNMATYRQKQFTGQLKDLTSGTLKNGHLTNVIKELGTDSTMVKPMKQRVTKSQFGLAARDKTDPGQPNSFAETNFLQGESSYMAPYKMYYAIVGGVQQGPFPMGQLQQMVQWGQLTPNTLVWTKGMVSWSKASSVSTLSKLFGAVPPPL
ncbi:MAG: SPFH domain-containing protein, partial [Bacteroidales bacterium]|nr:SPFH domain-containing protein [Bacteroidales bacterium]